MPYAQGRVIHDADSHIMESLEWLPSYAEPAIRDRLLSLKLEAGGAGAAKAIRLAQERQQDPAATAAIAENVVAGPKGWAAYGAMDPSERRRALDDLGFSRQLVFTTFAGSQFMPSKDLNVKYGGARALNRGIAEWCAGDDRLVAVGVVPLDDPERARAEVEFAIGAGCGAIWVPAAPAGDRSPGHPDLDPVWRRLAETGTPFMLHVGATAPVLQPAYHENGHPRPKDWLGGGENLRAKDFFALSFAPQNFLCSLALDGVFDRHPGLRGGVIELGAGWVPDMLRRLDQAWKGWRKTDPVLGALSMPPSEFIRRAVRFTPFATEDAGTIIREGGPELFLFSSDFPHPEGTKNPIERFEATFDGLGEDVKDRFYRRNFEDLFTAA
ncbi:amidohydrolase family protein [Phenylobacterium sp.]|uniref:amidohydrolase family protein n=1 Tax=Phenylobacterium sp. TaxID=1871053 RepID=UPI0028113865|nr:amidohydrolase family protein [Phenylobacterium sp.]